LIWKKFIYLKINKNKKIKIIVSVVADNWELNLDYKNIKDYALPFSLSEYMMEHVKNIK